MSALLIIELSLVHPLSMSLFDNARQGMEKLRNKAGERLSLTFPATDYANLIAYEFEQAPIRVFTGPSPGCECLKSHFWKMKSHKCENWGPFRYGFTGVRKSHKITKWRRRVEAEVKRAASPIRTPIMQARYTALLRHRKVLEKDGRKVQC